MNRQNTRPDIAAAFAKLRQRFVQELPGRVAKICEALSQSKEISKHKALAEIVAEAHKLAGACGTFGYGALGQHAKQVEMIATNVLAKPAQELQQSLPALSNLLQEFEALVINAVQAEHNLTPLTQVSNVQKNTVWLVLDDTALANNLMQQLVAFGHQVEVFDNYAACVNSLQTAAPAVLFCAIKLKDGEQFFTQNLLLNLLGKQKSRLVLYSDSDVFEQRIKAAQLRADAFFVSPLDISNIITAISELIDLHTGKAGRVFIVDDDKLLAEHYALVLQQIGIETRVIENVRNIVGELVRFQPDLLLMDMYMPEYSGAELAGLIRQYQSLKRLPIVFLSSEANKALQIQAMAYGADDFLTKPIADAELAQVIKVRLTRCIQIKNLIEKDGLTGLIKHSAIKQAVELELERVEREHKPLSVVMIDIDHFKAVNDSYGHAIGDVVISALATLLRKRIRKTDRAGRYGGEEFMLVLPDCNSAQARNLTNSILEAFRQLKFNAEDNVFSCTFSAGVVSTSDSSFSNAEQLVMAADDALYQAKAAGRNCIV